MKQWLILAPLLVACGGENQDDAGARGLLAKVRAEQYRSWQRGPGYEERQRSSSAHKSAVDIYVNERVAEVLAASEPATRWPQGSLIVKDGFDGSGALHHIAIMEKRSGGWYWAEYDDEDNPVYSGSPDICIGCHDAGSDFVLAFPLP